MASRVRTTILRVSHPPRGDARQLHAKESNRVRKGRSSHIRRLQVAPARRCTLRPRTPGMNHPTPAPTHGPKGACPGRKRYSRGRRRRSAMGCRRCRRPRLKRRPQYTHAGDEGSVAMCRHRLGDRHRECMPGNGAHEAGMRDGHPVAVAAVGAAAAAALLGFV
jgi:hypothetical protein